MENAFTFLYSKLLNPIETLNKERDQLLTTAEDLRAKLNEAVSKQQEIETQRDAALEKISQVSTECDSCVGSWVKYMSKICVTYCMLYDCAPS